MHNNVGRGIERVGQGLEKRDAQCGDGHEQHKADEEGGEKGGLTLGGEKIFFGDVGENQWCSYRAAEKKKKKEQQTRLREGGRFTPGKGIQSVGQGAPLGLDRKSVV